MRDAGDPGKTPAELLGAGVGAGSGFSSGRSGPVDESIWTDPSAWAFVYGAAAPQSPVPASATPAEPAAAAAAASSESAPASATPAHAADAPMSVDPAVSSAGAPVGPELRWPPRARRVAKIQSYLQPLGDGGYKIIPSSVISRFGQAAPEELRAALQDGFARRLEGYRALLAEIQAQSIPYLEFDSLVAAMEAGVTPEVHALVESDSRRGRPRDREDRRDPPGRPARPRRASGRARERPSTWRTRRADQGRDRPSPRDRHARAHVPRAAGVGSGYAGVRRARGRGWRRSGRRLGQRRDGGRARAHPLAGRARAPSSRPPPTERSPSSSSRVAWSAPPTRPTRASRSSCSGAARSRSSMSSATSWERDQGTAGAGWCRGTRVRHERARPTVGDVELDRAGARAGGTRSRHGVAG